MDEARDVAQQVFIKLYEKRETIQIKSSLKSYLFQAVRNTALNLVKHHQTHTKHTENVKYLQPKTVDDIDHQMRYSELESQIHRLIAQLPEKCREIFKMNRFEHKKNKEIAEELGISIRTVETQISKALKFLRANLSPDLLTAFLLFLTFF